MGQAIGQVLSFGVGVAISPLPIVGVILMLATPRGRVNGISFLGGWIAGLAALGAVVLLISAGAGASTDGGPATWVCVLKLVLGLLLLGLAVKQWRERPESGEQAELPKWMQAIDQFSAVKATGFGALMAAINPKNMLMTIGAAAAIAQSGSSAGDQAVALVVFIVIATIGVGVPVVLSFMGEGARHTLVGLRDWMGANNTAIMAVLFLVIGMKLIGDGITGLS
jgi:threonine/homoserine/homoserine lactone efflux protein